MKKKKKKTRNQGKWHTIVDYFKKHISIIGIMLTAIVSAMVTKACDKIIPDPPAIVEKVPDTISIVHVYEPMTDSTLNLSQKRREKIVDDAAVKKRVLSHKPKDFVKDNNVNIIAKDSSFPNAKGYSPRSAAPYFWLEMTDRSLPYIDFICHFFYDAIIEDIYCLSIKVFEIQNDGKKVYVLDENYSKQKGDNIIRLKNIFSSKNYEIEVGFVFNRDRNSKYPTFYREAKYINNKK